MSIEDQIKILQNENKHFMDDLESMGCKIVQNGGKIYFSGGNELGKMLNNNLQYNLKEIERLEMAFSDFRDIGPNRPDFKEKKEKK